MDPIAVTAALLRNQLPDVTIREGATLMARVASKGEGHAVIVIAGIPVTAKLPPEVPAGATLKLKVAEVTPERVTLRIEPQPSAKPAPASQPAPTGPATYAPPFEVSPEARCVPPNDLPRVAERADGYVVVGAGKTSADTCLWLLANGVPPDDIRWIKPREIALSTMLSAKTLAPAP